MIHPVDPPEAHDLLQDADSAYKTAIAQFAAGNWMETIHILTVLAQQRPDSALLRFWLGRALEKLGLPVDNHARADGYAVAGRRLAQLTGMEAYAQKLTNPEALRPLAHRLYQENLMASASYLFRQIIELCPPRMNDHLQLALSLQHQGRIQEALAIYRLAMQLWPDQPSLTSFYLYCLHFDEDDWHMRRLFAETRAWNARHAASLAPSPGMAWPNPPRAGRRLRIGYHSPVFFQHQQNYFFQPVLEAHDPAAVEIYCYASGTKTDAVTDKLRQSAHHWRDVSTLSDADFVAQARADEIDVMIDLWGHTIGNRLLAFAHRMAPVQVSWINYMASTGLDTMDYIFLTDQTVIPGMQEVFTETPYSIGPILSAYRPAATPPAPGEAPALRRGHVTFGCFNHPAKLSRACIVLWARLMAAVPDSRLVLKYRYFADPALQQRIAVDFQAEGIDSGRIEFRAASAPETYLEEYRDIDIALDPFPYQGGTTTADVISVGLPIITFQRPSLKMHLGTQFLDAVGMNELIAGSEDEFLEIGTRLAGDLPRLSALRLRIRQAFEASDYTRPRHVAARLEAACVDIFDRWQAGQ